MSGSASIELARRSALSALSFARQCTGDLLRNFPADHALLQLKESDPHAMWIVGHIAVSDEWIQNMVVPFDSCLPPNFKNLFGHNSVPKGDSDVYPPFHDVIGHFGAARARLIQAFEHADELQLTRPLGGAGVGFASNPLDAVNKTAWHEGWHAGQLSRIRQHLGLSSIFPDAS